jgi:thiamine biosynthesis lipoprotein
MGTTVRLYLFGGPVGLEDALRGRLNELEQRWSRFIDDSEVSRLNSATGEPLAVSGDTLLLVQRALTASKRTRGWFDPALLQQLVAAGYDRPFAEIPSNGIGDLVITVTPGADEPCVIIHDWKASARAIVVDTASGTVTVPESVGFDPGGIGKGLAADLLATQAMDAGATAVMVDLGGDIVAAGQAPPGGWLINIENPFDGAQSAASVTVPWGAVATSSRANRRWRVGDDERHHLIDPHTGVSSTSDVAACTVIGGDCWLAESFAKAALLAGVDEGLALVTGGGMEALMIDAEGDHHLTYGMRGFLT